MAVSAAQVPVKVNPTVAVFTASPTHATVTNYVLEVYPRTNLSTQARPATDLGKPTPNAANDITVPLTRSGLSNNTEYVFQIVTNSAGGSTRSAAPSNPFAWEDAPGAASNLRAQ